jgi:hypothetical protein
VTDEAALLRRVTIRGEAPIAGMSAGEALPRPCRAPEG